MRFILILLILLCVGCGKPKQENNVPIVDSEVSEDSYYGYKEQYSVDNDIRLLLNACDEESVSRCRSLVNMTKGASELLLRDNGTVFSEGYKVTEYYIQAEGLKPISPDSFDYLVDFYSGYEKDDVIKVRGYVVVLHYTDNKITGADITEKYRR